MGMAADIRHPGDLMVYLVSIAVEVSAESVKEGRGVLSSSARPIFIEPNLLGLQMTAGIMPHIGRLLRATAFLLQNLDFRLVLCRVLCYVEPCIQI